MYGNNEGKKVFSIPVEWTVTETLDIRANTLEEAIEFIRENNDIIPLGDDPVYLDGSYKISGDTEFADAEAREIECYVSEQDADSYDEIEELDGQNNSMFEKDEDEMEL